jgi:hypothetical protein
MMRWLASGCLAISVIVPMACHASEPRLVSLTDLGQAIAEARVTPDGHWAVVEMEAPLGQPIALQIIDASSLARPKLKGSIPIEGKGKISLSADGRLLLLLIEPPPALNGQVGGYLIEAFDLADPDHPKEAWRRSIAAFKVALAPNGLGYAALVPSGKARTPGRIPALIEVRWVDGSHADKAIEDDEAGLAISAFSSKGSMLLLNVGGYLKVYDLRLDKPIAIQQTGYSEVSRYICPQILESGNVVVRSAQWPRLEILALRPELPRIAAAPFESEPTSEYACVDVMGSAEHTIYLKGWNDNITALDLTRTEAPAVTRVWSMTANVRPVGVDGAKHLFAYGGDRLNQFVIYDLNDPIAAHVDWAVLAGAHEQALRIYHEKKDLLPDLHARKILEQAGVQRALNAPVEGIAPRKAAAILNDYAFLIARPWINRTEGSWPDREPPPAEPYLRRSIPSAPLRISIWPTCCVMASVTQSSGRRSPRRQQRSSSYIDDI